MAEIKADDLSFDNQFIKALVVGDYGTGKSVFGASFPEPILLFDFDKGALSYRGKRCDVMQYSISQKGWNEFSTEFTKKLLEVKEGKYKTVIFDSTSLLTDLAMEQALMLDPKRSPTGGPLWNVHYGMVRNLVEGKLRQLLQLNCNVLVIAHLEIVTDKESGNIMCVQPLLPGALSTKLPGYFDEVYYAFSRTKEGKPDFYLQTLPRGHYKARSRASGVQQYLPIDIPNNYPNLVKLLGEAAVKHAAAEEKRKALIK